MIRETKYNLIPDFVLEQYEGGNYCGRFQSIALFMDISGFTKMAQSFLRQEKEGVEELAAIINKIFDPIITIIERQGGFVATFAGDAITVLFPGSDESTALATCQTALQIRQIILQQGQYETPAGQYHLAVKQGLSAGEIEWGILGTESHKTYYFRGMGIERSTMAESRSKAGDIVIEESLFNLLSQTEFEYEKIEDGFHTLKYSNSLELINQPKPANNYPRTLTEQFFSTDLWGFIGLGEFRHVATLFLSFNADLPHDQLKGLVTATVELVDQYGGHFVEVDFGDKGGVIMLCFGAPKTHENALQRALEFSISLSLKLRDLNCEWGVGIANGQVYAGMIGTRLRAKYGVMGSSVNLAARLMSKAQQGQILVAESVSHQSGYRFNPIDPLNLKGFDSPVPAFVLAGILEDGPAEIKNYDDQLFVGRKAEQRQLLDFAQPVLDDRSAGIITIYGEPGIGKSVLANRFVAQFQEGVSWQFCAADQILKRSFNPFVSCLKTYFSQSGELSAEHNKTNFVAQWQLLDSQLSESDAPTKLKQEFARTRSFLGALLDLYWPGSLFEQLDGRLRYLNTIVAIKTWLFAQSYIQPAAILLEDAHWLDDASLDVLEGLSREISNHQILVVITSRYFDEDGAAEIDLFEDARQSVIHLEALEREAIQYQAEHILRGKVSDELCDHLLQRSQGNPFFVEQLILYFQESGNLAQDKTGKLVLQSADVTIPTSINSILVTRIDRLMQSAKEVVQTAAVLGQEFDLEVLNEMFLGDVDEEINEAEEKQIWQSLNGISYIFRHVLLRDAAYDMQLRQRLNELHLLAAEVYQKLYVNHLEPHYAALAYHYRAANTPEFELYFSRFAAEQAREKGNHKDALDYFNRCIELAEGDELIDFILQREDVYHLMGDREKQGEDIIQLSEAAFLKHDVDEAHRIEHLVRQTTISLRHARYRSATSDYPGAILAAKHAIDLTKQSDDLEQRLEGRYWWGEALQQQGAYEEAKTQFNLALKSVKYAADPNLKASLMKEVGWIAFRQGNSILAMEKLGEALQIAQLKGNLREEMKILKALGGAANGRGNYASARNWQLQGLSVAREIGHVQEEGSLLINLGNTSRFMGDYELAEEYHLRGAEKVRKAGWRIGEATSYINLGFTQQYLGNYKKGMQYVQTGLAIAQEIGAKMIQGVGWYIVGSIYEKLNNWTDAAQGYNLAAEFSQSMGLAHYTAEAHCGLVRVYLSQEMVPQMQESLKELIKYLDDGGSVLASLEPIHIYLTCFQALKRLKHKDALDYLQLAISLLTEQANRFDDEAELNRFLKNVSINRQVQNAAQELNLDIRLSTGTGRLAQKC